MEEIRKYPAGIQTFEKIREEGYVYIDKTAQVYKLVTYGSQYVFLSRPRRFGKSLLVSTLKAYFEGRRDLFKGLAIDHLEKDWTKHPVLLLSLASVRTDDTDAITQVIDKQFEEYEARYQLPKKYTDLGTRLAYIVQGMSKATGQKAVVLIDEYDAPLLHTAHDKKRMDKMRLFLQMLYAHLKDLDPVLRFVFITGITKFSQVSIFSTLNNIHNISMWDAYASICGFTLDELMCQMRPDIEMLSEALHLTIDQALDTLKEYYDGYSFTPALIGLFNPFSILRCFQEEQIQPYWFSSGTPTFLIELMKQYNVHPSEIGGYERESSQFDTPIDEIKDVASILYQSGYLTIKGYDPETESFFLTIPNKEVRLGLMNSLIPNYLQSTIEVKDVLREVTRSLAKEDIEGVLKELKAFFATVPYCENINYEGHWQQMLYVVFSLMGARADVEVRTSKGRVDMAMVYRNRLYLWEIKLNGSARKALQQIDKNNYAARFRNLSYPITKIGVNFSTRSRTITSWQIGMDSQS